MERALVGRAVPEEGEDDPVGALHPLAQGTAHRQREPAADEADGPEDTRGEILQVQLAAFPRLVPDAFPQISAIMRPLSTPLAMRWGWQRWVLTM